MTIAINLKISTGKPIPYGISKQNNGFNFSVTSSSSKSLILYILDPKSRQIIAEVPFSPQINKTGDVWHIHIQGLDENFLYAYRASPALNPTQDLLVDPYAKSVNSEKTWGTSGKYIPLGEHPLENTFDWGNDTHPRIPLNNLIIYEMHVRGFTQDASSEVKHPGTFLGIIEKIPYLLDLGVNAVELMPIHEFDENEYSRMHPNSKNKLFNYWGYSTVNFFAPMARYGTPEEFKIMVRELHRSGIEVILDVVYNHTAEGNEDGPVYSYKGFDNDIYYMIDNQEKYRDYTGCGNTFNANHPIAQDLIIQSLRYWVTEMHVDGFRFDLASALTRALNGDPISMPPVILAITNDPILSSTKLIAEAWDAAGLYQVGNFVPESKRWAEWNGKYRDTIRRYVKGNQWTQGEFAMRLSGSDDLYHSRGPTASVNFLTSHDGFSLHDLVSYNAKQNLANGEENRDGMNENDSWNCGVEGPTDNKKVLCLRDRQMRNLHLAFMVSQGVPMLLMGDEYGHTKLGNNNTWCQDNKLNWFLWDELIKNANFYRFYKMMITFRKANAVLHRTKFLTNKDIEWHGLDPFKPDWNSPHNFIAYTLKDSINGHDIYIAFNAQNSVVTVHLPPPPFHKKWYWVANTGNPSPTDIYDQFKGPAVLDSACKMSAYSALILQAY